MLEDEIDLERPVLYSGAALLGGGHSWVIEGYDNSGRFYCNWGWYGNLNGFYSLGGFDPPGDPGPYNQYESGIFNVVPTHMTSAATPDLSPQTFTYNPNGYTLSIPEAFGATSYEWNTDQGTISGSGTTVTLYSNCTANVQVRAYNNICEVYSPYDTEQITVEYGSISGNYLLCSVGTSYSLSNLPSGSSISWSCSSNISRVSSQGSNPCTFSANGNGTGWVEATVTNCGVTTLPQKAVWVGPPSSNNFDISNTATQDNTLFEDETNQLVAIDYDYQTGVTDWDWDYGGWYHWEVTETDMLSFVNVPYSFNYRDVKVRAENTCGESSWYTERFYPGGYYYFSVFPNPADDYVKITIEPEKEAKNKISKVKVTKGKNSDGIGEYTIEIWSEKGGKLISTKSKEKSLQLSTRDLLPGTYFLHLILEGETYKQQLIIY